MSTEQENFDDILKSKLSEGEFEFNEANWDKAEALIIQADKKRKRRLIGFIFFIGLILGVCLMIPFIGSEKESLRNENKTNTADKKEVEESDSKAEKRETNQASDAPSDSKYEENNKQTNTTQTNETALKENTETNFSKEDKPVNTNSSQKITSNKMIVSAAKKEEKSIPTKSSYNNNSATNDAFVSNPETPKASKTEKQKGRGEAENSSIIPPATKGKELLSNKDVKKASKQEQVATRSKETQPLSKTTDTTYTSSITNNNALKDTAITVKDSIAKTKTDSIKPVAKETTPEAKKESLKQATVFCIDAGASYALGWKYNTIKEAAGFNAVLGASVMHYFSIKWSVLAGLLFNSLAHLSYSNYSSTSTQYNFGYNQTKTTVTPKMIYYMAIPLKWQYHINENNSISLGVNILYLLNTSSTIDTYTQTDFTTSNHTTVTKRGYMDGFSTWDIQPALAYRRRIYKNFSISGEAYYGLMDVKNNSFFGINKSEKNSGLKFVLSYSFVK